MKDGVKSADSRNEQHQPAVTHHSVATGPLRNCTCSHFLLFVWGGLALGRYWVKLEHQSATKARKKPPYSGSPSQSASRPAHLRVSPDGHAICRYVTKSAMDGAAALETSGAGGDVRWLVMMAGNRRAVCVCVCVFSISLLVSSVNLVSRSQGNRELLPRFSRFILTHDRGPR